MIVSTWSSDSNWTWTHNYLVYKQTLNHTIYPNWPVVVGSSPVAVTKFQISHLLWAKSSLDTQATIEFGFTLIHVHDMIRTYSQLSTWYLKEWFSSRKWPKYFVLLIIFIFCQISLKFWFFVVVFLFFDLSRTKSVSSLHLVIFC